MTNALKPQMFAVILPVSLTLLIAASFDGDDGMECNSDMECVKVYGKQLTCEDGVICTDSMPSSLSIDCYKMLVDYPNPILTSKFGEPRGEDDHNGIDLAVPTGTDLRAAKNGTVVETVDKFKEGDRSTPNGNFVRIDYEDNTQGVYIHMLEVKVKVEQVVEANQVIGTSNDTGKSNGPHLHYTIYDEFGIPINPINAHGDC